MPLRLVPVLVVVCSLVGCGSSYTERQQQWRADAARGQVSAAADAIDDQYNGEERRGEAVVSVSDSLIWAMERGAVAGMAGDYPAAIRFLDLAAVIGEENRPVALAREIGTYALNDQLRTYDGWTHEHALVDALRVLSHLELAQRAEGLVPGGARDANAAFIHYERAINVGRRLSLTLPQWIRDQHASAYPDEAFGRMLGAAMAFTLPFDQRVGGDMGAADTGLRLAKDAFRAQAMALAGKSYAPWAPAAEPKTLMALWTRSGAAGDEAATRAIISGVPAAIPAGSGSLLVLDLAGYVPQLEQLRFTMIAGHASTGRDRNGTRIGIGSFTFWVEGPGHEITAFWPPFVWPQQWIKPIAPGGLAVFGFEVPVFAPPKLRSAPVMAQIHGPNATAMQLEPLSDPEALARGILAERQPSIVIKTLARAVVKQVGVGVAADALRKDHEVLGLAVNLIGSLLATWSEQADLRSWVTLPSRIDGGLIDLPAGTYTIDVPGAPARTVTIPVGRLVVVPVRTFRDGTPQPP